jgi:hypothetical protein
MKTLRLIWLAALMTAVTLVPSTAGSSTRVSAAGKQYLGDVAPLNATISKWNAETTKWTKSTTNAQIKAQTTPLIAAFRTFQQKLLHQLWPTKKAARDVEALYTSVSFLESILNALDTLTMPSAGAYLLEVQGQDSITASNANPVRHDLGLAVLKTPSGRKLNYKF